MKPANPLDPFAPWTLRGLTLSNRFIKAATFEGHCPGGRHRALAEGYQAVRLGRALIHDPALVRRYREGSKTE